MPGIADSAADFPDDDLLRHRGGNGLGAIAKLERLTKVHVLHLEPNGNSQHPDPECDRVALNAALHGLTNEDGQRCEDGRPGQPVLDLLREQSALVEDDFGASAPE